MPKRIAVNTLAISHKASGGRTYLLNLMDALTRLAGADYVFILVCTPDNEAIFRNRLPQDNTRFEIVPRVSNVPGRIAAEQFYLPLWLRRNRIDLLFAARNIMPVLAPCATVVAVHSMHLNYRLNEMPWYQRAYGHTLLRTTARRADAILAVSDYAGRTYAQQYQVPPERVFVTHEGYNQPESCAPEKDLIGYPYLLFVSTLFPHKNVSFLLQIFSRIARSHATVRLVIAGRDPADLLPGYQQQAAELGILERVDFKGAVSDEELLNLYAFARVFVFPSLIEGFGLPVLEAMAHGVPVVVSSRTSLPEVAGDAGCVLEPEDAETWAAEVSRILADPGRYEQLSRQSKRRAGQFTWQRAAEISLACFNQVLAEKR